MPEERNQADDFAEFEEWVSQSDRGTEEGELPLSDTLAAMLQDAYDRGQRDASRQTKPWQATILTVYEKPATEFQVRVRWPKAEDLEQGVWLLDLTYDEFASAQLGEPTRSPDGTLLWLEVPMP